MYKFTERREKEMRLQNRILKAGICLLAAVSLLTGCDKKSEMVPAETSPAPKPVVIGFSQLGAESDWRSANTQSMKTTFTAENGYQLIFEDGQQKQSNQIRAIRTFIQQDVDYIVLAPVTETGWDTVLQEAKDAGIPVILLDRQVDATDDSLFTCWVGSDFELEGRKVTEWLRQYTIRKGIDPSEIHIVNIQGTIGASAQIGRTMGLARASEENGWELLAEVPGDFTQTKGREVMAELLNMYEDLNVVYCENDNEAFGAIEAIEAAGKKAGSDLQAGEIMVISFDGVKKEAMEYVYEDKISCIGECNPEQGAMVQEVIGKLERGETPEKFSYVQEGMLTHDNTVPEVMVGGKKYPVTVVTGEMIQE